MSPVLLYGPPGTGKSSLADIIATYAQAASTEIDASAGAAAFRVTGVEAGWSFRQIGEPLRVIVNSECPNPVVIVNETDKALGGMQSSSDLPRRRYSLQRGFVAFGGLGARGLSFCAHAA